MNDVRKLITDQLNTLKNDFKKEKESIVNSYNEFYVKNRQDKEKSENKWR